jgi:DNA polymerase III subunit epsilon
MKRKLLVVDTETGGLDPAVNAILSIAALVVNAGAIEGQVYAVVDEGDGGGSLDPAALKVNGFTAEGIKAEGKTPRQVVEEIEAMLQAHDMRQRVTICAHNAAFDVAFMRRLWARAGKDFNKRFSYRPLCTVTGALLLEQAGRLQLPGGSASLDTLAAMWNIPTGRLGTGVHGALGDAIACAAILRKELELLR